MSAIVNTSSAPVLVPKAADTVVKNIMPTVTTAASKRDVVERFKPVIASLVSSSSEQKNPAFISAQKKLQTIALSLAKGDSLGDAMAVLLASQFKSANNTVKTAEQVLRANTSEQKAATAKRIKELDKAIRAANRGGFLGFLIKIVKAIVAIVSAVASIFTGGAAAVICAVLLVCAAATSFLPGKLGQWMSTAFGAAAAVLALGMAVASIAQGVAQGASQGATQAASQATTQATTQTTAQASAQVAEKGASAAGEAVKKAFEQINKWTEIGGGLTSGGLEVAKGVVQHDEGMARARALELDALLEQLQSQNDRNQSHVETAIELADAMTSLVVRIINHRGQAPAQA